MTHRTVARESRGKAVRSWHGAWPRSIVLWATVLLGGIGSPAAAAPADDAYAAGYAAAMLERDFRVSVPSLAVRDGVVFVAASDVASAPQPAVETALRRVRGVNRVVLLEAASAEAPPGKAAAAAAVEGPAVEILPAGLLFRPLIADPRWPHFSTTVRTYLDDSRFGAVAAVSLGDMLPIVRGRVGERAQWEAGLYAAAFGLFDMDAKSADLINIDYVVGGFASVRQGAWSGIARVFHASSHLGDEEVLNRGTNRLNLSYEAVDSRVAYEIRDWLRVYAGAGYLLRVGPTNYAPWSLTAGAELQSPWSPWPGRVRPVFAVDVQSREEHDWRPQLSMRAGLELDSVAVLDRRIQFLIEYFTGHAVDGQLYTREVEYLGLGVHFKF